MRRHLTGIARFGAVGIANTATDFAVFFALAAIGTPALLANAAGFLVANLQSFVVNAHVTFRENGAPARLSVGRYVRFAAAHGLSLVVSTVLILLLADAIGPVRAKLSAVAVSLVANYFFSSKFVFRPAAAGPAVGGRDGGA